jgi:hypothetical protein
MNARPCDDSADQSAAKAQIESTFGTQGIGKRGGIVSGEPQS